MKISNPVCREEELHPTHGDCPTPDHWRVGYTMLPSLLLSNMHTIQSLKSQTFPAPQSHLLLTVTTSFSIPLAFLALINDPLLQWQLLPIPPPQHFHSRGSRHSLCFIVTLPFYYDDWWTRWLVDNQQHGEKQLISSNRMEAVVKLVNCFPSVSCF